MDLREKPGKVQKFFELMLRFRLIAIVVMVVATVAGLAKMWDTFVGYPTAVSENFGMWLFAIGNAPEAWDAVKYLAVAGIASVVMLFVFGGVRAGIASIVSTILAFAAFYVQGGCEDLAIPMFCILAGVSLVLFLFVKKSVACMLFPFVLSWLFLGTLLSLKLSICPNYFVWGVFSTFGFAMSMAYAVVAGKLLGEGVPQAGALVKAAKQLFVPVLLGTLLLVAAISVDMRNILEIAGHQKMDWSVPVIWFVAFIVWFFVFLVPISSFAPWERLRSGSRRVEMKDKKKNSDPKKKK